MEIQYVHVKTRSQFGKQCIFDDEGPTVDENILPNRDLMNDYIYRDPCHIGVQNSKQFAVHEVQTTSAPTTESGMSHTEGGWPKEVNFKDEEATARFRRRVEKDDIWPIKMKKLMEPMERCVLQNNAVNIYENFFDDMVTTELVLPLDVRTVNVYEDPQTLVRPITHLSWSPDHGKRLAVSYCSREFERESIERNRCSYIWEIDNPNTPLVALEASCPSVTIEFNPRDPSMLISGLMTGQVCNWDIRQGNKPVQMSHLQFSHRNPTNLALWINSKTNTEFFSASTGGAIKWWDLRKLREPTETLVMDLENPSRGDYVRAIGVSSLQFEPTMGTKFMAGMENGIVVSGTRKGKNAQEKLALRFPCHDGPVVAIDRNPFSTKNFLTVGGWVARIWAEDTREGNLVSNKRDKIALTGGCWSTSRCSVFYLIDESGVLKVYDALVGMGSPVKSSRLCENGLKAISPHEEGNLVAVGSDMGKVYLVESSEGLTTNARNDKVLVTSYMDRCSRYVKAVDNRLKEVRLAQRISYEIVEEPVLPTKGKSKGGGKDPRVKDGNANDKKMEDKSAKGGAIEDRDKKSRMKMKKFKDNVTSTGDPELDDAENRYYEVVNKETERYAEVAALEDLEGNSVGTSSTTTTTTTTAEGRRRKLEDPRQIEKETSGASKRGAEKKDEIERRKSRKSRVESRSTRGDIGIEEIVVVRRKKGEAEAEGADTSEKMTDERKELEIIREEHEEADDETLNEETKKSKDPRKRHKKGKKEEKRRGKIAVAIEESPMREEKLVPSMEKLTEERSKTDIMIEEMLMNLPKVATPDELGHLLDPIDETLDEKLILAKKDERPRILDEAVKVARREIREWKKSMMHGKSKSPIKLQRHRGNTNEADEKLDEIFEDPYYEDIQREDSKFMDRTSIERISIDDAAAIDRENYTMEKSNKARKMRKVKMSIDCEPVAVKFGEKEIKEIIGVPDAPKPPSLPRFDETKQKITKTKFDYPRISAAAFPKLKSKDDPSSN